MVPMRFDSFLSHMYESCTKELQPPGSLCE